jgi:phosphoenolpyruvate synthase/pyruvate phosphate dikinase
MGNYLKNVLILFVFILISSCAKNTNSNENDIETVGAKNASPGEIIQNLISLGINILNGFVVTIAACNAFLEYNNLSSTSSLLLINIPPCHKAWIVKV